MKSGPSLVSLEAGLEIHLISSSNLAVVYVGAFGVLLAVVNYIIICFNPEVASGS